MHKTFPLVQLYSVAEIYQLTVLSCVQVGNISQMIAYPDAIFNDTYLLESSKAVNITRGQSYFLTAQTAQTVAVLDNLQELYKPVNKSKLVFLSKGVVGAIYSSLNYRLALIFLVADIVHVRPC